MIVVAISDFKGEQEVAGTENVGTRQSLQGFIDEYEADFLNQLLGPDLATLFIEGLTEDPVDQRWTDLKNNKSLKKMIVQCVYFWYWVNLTSVSSPLGELKPKAENSNRIDNMDKMFRAWNDMAKSAKSFTLDADIYPEFTSYWNRLRFAPRHWFCDDDRNIFDYKNRFGI